MNRAELVQAIEDQLSVNEPVDAAVADMLLSRALEHLRQPDLVGDVEAFASKYKVSYDGKPRVLPLELAEFRREFLVEESREYSDATFFGQRALSGEPSNGLVADALADMLDALVDAVYVAVGSAGMHGFDFREAWRRVHAANMAKVRAERASDSKRGTLWDVVKPPGWTPPDHSDLVCDHAHRVTP